MSSEPVLQVEGLSKSYRLYADPRQRLWEALSLGRRTLHHEFWALRDVSLAVGRGESVGIIGRNGSGKSTLLQCIAGTLEPTAGRVQVRGRVAALLELGSGFNPDFTGRENVFLACAVLGLTRREAQERFDAIAAFADIGEFIDQPVKTYSSGMAVRLAFAVQTAVEPDLLIVDEALAVGDIFFQQKCLARMRELRDKGVAVLFVSHDMGLVRDLTQRTCYLRNGSLEYWGPTHMAIHGYLQEQHGERRREELPAAEACAAAEDDTIAGFLSRAQWTSPVAAPSATGRILAVAVVGDSGAPAMTTAINGNLKIQVLYTTGNESPLHVAVEIKNRHNLIISSRGSYTENVAPPRQPPGQTLVFELSLECALEAGEYTFCAKLGDEPALPNRGKVLDTTDWIGPLRVMWDYENKPAPFLGMFGVPVSCRFIDPQEASRGVACPGSR